MTSQLMPRRLNRPDQIGVALRYPTQNKECGVETEFPQQIKHFVSVSHNARLHGLPASKGNSMSKGRDMEIVLDVDRQRIRTRSVLTRSHCKHTVPLRGLRWLTQEQPWVKLLGNAPFRHISFREQPLCNPMCCLFVMDFTKQSGPGPREEFFGTL